MSSPELTANLPAPKLTSCAATKRHGPSEQFGTIRLAGGGTHRHAVRS